MNTFDPSVAANQRNHLLVQHMMGWVAKRAGDLSEEVRPALRALIQHGLEAGEAALPLGEVHRRWAADASFNAWKQALSESPAVHVLTPESPQPNASASFVLDGDELMTVHVHRERQTWQQQLLTRATQTESAPWRDAPQAVAKASEVFGLSEEQQHIVQHMMHRGLTLVTGGPGSGKTYIASALVYALLQAGLPPDQLALLSPTNKAAERLRSTLTGVLKAKRIDAAAIHQLRITTVHRCLGLRPGQGMHRQDWLKAQCVVVDEMSMVGRSLMLKLLSRLNPKAQIIMIGDPDQLPPVQGGDAFGQLIEQAQQASTPQALQHAHHHLDVLRRFDDANDVAAILDAIKQQDSQATVAALTQSGAVTWHPHSAAGDAPEVMASVQPHLQRWQNVQDIDQAWALLGEHAVITAHRQDARTHNQACLNALKVRSSSGLHPIILTANAPSLKFLNGDIGVTNGRGQAWFSNAKGERTQHATHQLPSFQPAFAITVHRAQGSEYQHTTIISPPTQDTAFNQRWLYTAISRARKHSQLFASEAVLQAMLTQ